nr:MAG TPA: hypothetical protein [Caudoviricetes sp.]
MARKRGGNKAHKLNLFISLNTEPKKIKKTDTMAGTL